MDRFLIEAVCAKFANGQPLNENREYNNNIGDQDKFITVHIAA
jgi:hypothetical protein